MALQPATMCQIIRLPPIKRKHSAATTNPATKQLIGITISSACKLEMTDCVENTDAIIEVINTATIRLRTFRVTLGTISLAH